jgi:hypothetical protein
MTNFPEIYWHSGIWNRVGAREAIFLEKHCGLFKPQSDFPLYLFLAAVYSPVPPRVKVSGSSGQAGRLLTAMGAASLSYRKDFF